MMTLGLILLGSLLAVAADHESQNPIYRELRQSGVAVGPEANAPLPVPAMPDGLSREAQLAALKEVIGQDYAYREFVRPSAVAPFKLRLRDVEPSDPKAPARGLDVYFVVYGDLETIASEEFLDRGLEPGRGEGEARPLSPEELESREIRLDLRDQEQEGFVHFDFPLLDRVQISAVMHSYWSRTEDSIVVAGHIDRRFLDDDEYPNQWRPIRRVPGGRDELGEPQPYDGVGYYTKITRLAEPEGALFVESHLIFVEPHGWFDGANLLRSKIPPVVQAQVRDFRRELARASR